jgi:hypothetical protein
VRELLAPLKELAERHNLAILLVAHLNKAQGLAAIDRVLASVGFTAAVRAVYMLAPDPDDDKRLLFLPEKASNAPAKMLGLSYRLQSADLGGGIVAPRIVWEATEMRSADEVLNPSSPDREAPERDEAERWLRERLADGPVPVSELREEASLEVEASWRTIERAARQLGVIGRGEKRARTWELNDKTTKRHPPRAEGMAESTPAAPQTAKPETRDGDGLGGLGGKPAGSSGEPGTEYL